MFYSLGPLSECRHDFRPGSVSRPKSLSDIVDAVNSARERGETVTAVGMGHSYADIAVPDDSADRKHTSHNGSLHICMHCYSGLVNLDSSTGLLTVLGGTTIEEIIAILDENKRALNVIPTAVAVTIAGALSTGELYMF